MDRRYLIVVSVLTLGIFGVHLLPKTSGGNSDGINLGAFPETVGGWIGYDRSFSDAIVRQLGANQYLMRQYSNGEGELLWLHIGYFRNQRASLRGHVPEICYPAQGWIVQQLQNHAIQINTTGKTFQKVKIKRLLVKREGQREEILYWWQSGEKIIASKMLFQLRLLLQAVLKGRSDGLIVIISAPATARGHYLEDFFRQILPILPSYI